MGLVYRTMRIRGKQIHPNLQKFKPFAIKPNFIHARYELTEETCLKVLYYSTGINFI